MGLTKYKLGQFIELRDIRNKNLMYGIDDVRGVNISKQLMPTRADLTTRDLSKFQIVAPNEFVFNHRTSRNGSKFSIAFNDSNKDIICTEDYVVFRINEEGKKNILPEWLYMFFNRPEFDRYVITNSWGSSTEFYNWEDLCDVDIVIPHISVQKKFVDVYNSMLDNQRNYERGLEDLKLTIDIQIDKLKSNAKKFTISDLLEEIDNRNTDGKVADIQGINITKQFMKSVADTTNVNLSRYKIVEKNQFAYSGMQTGRDECIRISLYTEEKPIIISPAYSVLQVKTENVLPEYIMMWFSRKEIDRMGWFMSDSSIRSNLDMDRFFEMKVPVPDMVIQKSLVSLYKAYVIRRGINEKLKTQIKDICPILIKGSLERN